MGLLIAVGVLALSSAAPVRAQTSWPQGFLAVPKAGEAPGVLVLHPWWGLNADTKAFCKRLADAGFVAFAPDLFDGKLATTRAEAEALVGTRGGKEAETKARIREAATFLAERSGREDIAVVGFSFGAYHALQFANEAPARVRAVVDFYGTGPEDFTKSKAAYLGHFAEKDEFEPKASVDALEKSLRAAGRPATFHTYPGTGHWFFEPSVTTAYDRAAAELAWKRTLEFLKATAAKKGAKK